MNRELEELCGSSHPVNVERPEYFSKGAVNAQYKALAGSKRTLTNNPAISFNWRELVLWSTLCEGSCRTSAGRCAIRNPKLCKNGHIQTALITVLSRLATANRSKLVSLHPGDGEGTGYVQHPPWIGQENWNWKYGLEKRLSMDGGV